MLVWAKVMAEMIMASCMGPESITLLLVNAIITLIIIKSIKNSLCPWQSPGYFAPGKKGKNHSHKSIKSTSMIIRSTCSDIIPIVAFIFW